MDAKRHRSTPEERQRAHELREKGRSYGQIAYILGRDWKTIYCWLNPEAQRKNREKVAAWRRRKPVTAKRSRNAAYRRAAADGKFGSCKHCSRPLRGTKKSVWGVCRRCLQEDCEFFWREVQELWEAGHSARQIAKLLGREVGAIHGAIRCMREKGWNVPYRRLDTRRLTLGTANV